MKELIEKFKEPTMQWHPIIAEFVEDKKAAKQCAIIALEHTIKALKLTLPSIQQGYRWSIYEHINLYQQQLEELQG